MMWKMWFQEVLIAIHNQRHTYDAGQPVTAWCSGLRATSSPTIAVAAVRATTMSTLTTRRNGWPPRDHDAHDARRDVGLLLDELPEKQRDAIRCVKIEGLSIAEAAAQTGQSESSVKVGIIAG